MAIELLGSKDIHVERRYSYKPLPAMHHHRSYELYYLEKGEREYFIEDRFFKVTAGDVVCIPKKVLHRTAGEGGMRYLVHFSDEYLHRFFTPALLDPLLERLPFVFRPEEPERGQITDILQTLLTIFTAPDTESAPERDPLLAGHLHRLLFLMAYSANSYVPGDSDDPRITEIIRFVGENYSQITGIGQIADHLYVSKYYLCRYFRNKLGVPLISYLNTVKIQHACDLIKSGQTNLTQVAMACGFNSSSYFCKVFKSEKGLSPSEYKQRLHR